MAAPRGHAAELAIGHGTALTYADMTAFVNRVVGFPWTAVQRASMGSGSMHFTAEATLDSGRVVEFRRLRVNYPPASARIVTVAVAVSGGAESDILITRELEVELSDPADPSEQMLGVRVKTFMIASHSVPTAAAVLARDAIRDANWNYLVFKVSRTAQGAVGLHRVGTGVGTALAQYDDIRGTAPEVDIEGEVEGAEIASISVHVDDGGQLKAVCTGLADMTLDACTACGAVRSGPVYCGAACQARAVGVHADACMSP